ncbi:helix-turn-helix domain-containing protein [Acetanaerobacterium elongatum]|uniref:Helix-turn-helix domain-containing protein n=1 Tax=Acetanaerobacterium elongatum TaxID=258515 RepID=A0A1H0C9G1_9FIRM|nr:hypothetical protein [Acetanaerobacterium elongatum]SDN54530.1 hypothetical protein SAMN05192585_12231 [Acetanaerobacterium elongatum]
MNYIKMPNCLFKLGLKANELVMLTYLASIHKPDHQDYVVAKYETIAKACGYTSADSAMTIVSSLEQKGFISIIPRHNPFTGITLANGYIVNLPATKNGYFKVDREMFRKVAACTGTTATAIYLYILRCMNNTAAAFPSLSNIRDNVHLTIATIVKKIRALQEYLFLKKQNRRKQDGSFSHNLYILLFGEQPKAKQKKKGSIINVVVDSK